MIAELNATNNSVINSYLWGLDLSGTQQGAGGVGGLLAIKSTGNGTHFTAFDGNGNITALASVTNASSTAQYEYDPFLNLLRETGPMAKLNDFTGSTMPRDRETATYYYGYRYLRNGRWLSKDPVQESGGLNLLAFVMNDAINGIDVGGTYRWSEEDYRRRTQPIYDSSADRYRGGDGRFVQPPLFPGRVEQPLPLKPPMPGLPKGGKKDSPAGGLVDLVGGAADLLLSLEHQDLIRKGRARCRSQAREFSSGCRRCCVISLYKVHKWGGRIQWYGGYGNIWEMPCNRAKVEFFSGDRLLPLYDRMQKEEPLFIDW